MVKSGRILLVGGDEALAEKEAAALEAASFEVRRVVDVASGLQELYEARPDLIIMAGELPPVNREDPYLRMRQASYIPIIVLGSEEEAAVDMLESGADAYMTKPPDVAELIARVRALLRRKQKSDPPRDNRRLEIRDRLSDDNTLRNRN